MHSPGAGRTRLVKPSNVRYIQSVHKFDLTGFILHSGRIYARRTSGRGRPLAARIRAKANARFMGCCCTGERRTVDNTDYIVQLCAIDCDFCLQLLV